MEYCSRPNLAARYRAERLSVAEVLRIGVRIAGAVETAHRAGILHRDIKPANVLTTDFGHPVLSDFGISVSRAPRHRGSTGDGSRAGRRVGMSIPWTAPEMFTEGATGDERADVYSLAATLYTVLARRSPFDRPGGPNRSADLIGRIRNSPVPALGRTDVPRLPGATAGSGDGQEPGGPTCIRPGVGQGPAAGGVRDAIGADTGRRARRASRRRARRSAGWSRPPGSAR